MLEKLTISSHRGPYEARFVSRAFEGLENGLAANEHLLIDARVAELHSTPLAKALSGASVLKIEATEANKSLEALAGPITHLLERGIRRDHVLVAVGGGIVQDITAFIAATLLRGLSWRFHPTTLLAQADSGIGSKSSINVGRFKNQLGTFTPPNEVLISTDVLSTLPEADLRSGIGEMIKVAVIAGQEDADRITQDYPKLLKDRAVLERTIRRSLEIKKTLIEKDEFDKDARLVLNYGHTFGHALESATQYAIPHGIAVTIGMDIANRFSEKIGLVAKGSLDRLNAVIAENFRGFENVPVPEEKFFDALSRDKKNAGADVRCVLLRGPGKVFLDRRPLAGALKDFCREYLAARKPAGAAR